MMVTYKAANENDWFRPEKETSNRCPRPCLGIPFIVSNRSRISNCRYHLARVLASPENGKRSCLRTTKNVKKNPRFQGNPLAGFYLTTIGRF
jgi:hypothetical protein